MMKYRVLVILVFCLIAFCKPSTTQQREELSNQGENWMRFTNCNELRRGWCECQECGCVGRRKRFLKAIQSEGRRAFRFTDCNEFTKNPDQEQHGPMYYCTCYGQCRCVL
ncbi:unnamed protein product [Owenia fusiformis]|uniref:Uncharacterized protein n=1 Tax=Owenia fusiformis TaxID=6347 RepID=A0A8J1UD29_OWEFU|nr:unnamed protein product [Owenia fusiformis]